MKASATASRSAQDRDLYDMDFFEWTQRTADLLRRGRFHEMDIEHAAEEIEDMGRRDLREVNIRLQVVLIHLLKWEWQPKRRSKSWQSTLLTQRIEIEVELEDSPSLRRRMAESLGRTYARAVKLAAVDTGLPAKTFPRTCPFALEQALDTAFLPD